MKDSMNYYHTFICVSPDTRATTGIEPQGESVAAREFRMIREASYQHTQEEILFQVEMSRKGVIVTTENRDLLWGEFFAKSRACLRASGLVRRHGWGIHFDQEGRAALHAMDSARYAELAGGADGVKVVNGMRTSRKA